MSAKRVLAAFVILFVFMGATAFAYSLEITEEEGATAAPKPNSTTTEEPDFEVLVESGFVDTLVAQEEELTDEAVERGTSTTTTEAPSTTKAKKEKPRQEKSSSPPRTSPPQTSPPQTSPPTTQAPSNGGYSSGAESEFASKINSFRGSNGESSLKRSGSLDSYARSWAKKMAQNGGISHSSIGSLLGTWSAVAENVGMGGSVSGIFDALKSSSGHRANMLGDYTHMGVGVWRDSNGTIWTAHVFAR